ncbi:MAG: translocation/assembly module TamB domain-containing protein [Halieaceae bacterium]|nr:translocation/assembly module TamB domain-containing protein [Halieaceae bacterium]
MSKIARLTLATGLALLLLGMLALAGVAWMLASESGTRWIASEAADRLGGGLRWEALSGTLWQRLEISGLEVDEAGLRLSADAATFAWQPEALLHGELRVSALTLSNARLVLSDGPQQQPIEDEATTVFDPADLRLPVALSLDGVRLEGLSITLPDGTRHQVDSLALAASLAGDRFALRALDLRLPQGAFALSGKARLRSEMPFELSLSAEGLLPADAATAAPRPLSAEMSLDGSIDWREGIAAALAYSLSVQGTAALAPDLPDRLAASGRLDASQSQDQLHIEDASLALEDFALNARLRGDVSGLASEQPTLSAELSWEGLQWPLAAPDYRSDAGRVSVDGQLSEYRLGLVANAAGEGLPDSSWTARVSGSGDQLLVESLRGELLGGALEISGPVSLNAQASWDLLLAIDDIDPRSLVPELDGPVTASLRTRGSLDADGAPTAEVTIERLRATASGYPMELEGELGIEGERVEIARIDLRSEVGELHADGSLSASLVDVNWQLAVPSIGALLPAADGRIDGAGRLSGTPEAPVISARLTAPTLSIETLTIDALDLDLLAGLAADAPLRLNLAIAGVRDQDEVIAERVSLKADGSTAAHRLELDLDALAADLRLSVAGGLAVADARWEGQLSRLSVASDAAGTWELSAPAPLTLAADRSSLGDSCLERREGPGQLCTSASWASSGSGDLALDLAALPIEAFVPTLTGELSGRLRAALAGDGGLSAEGRFDLASGIIRLPDDLEAQPLAHNGGQLDLTISEAGLRAEAAFAAPEEGQLDLQLALPELQRLPLASPQPLRGQLRASLPDLAIIAALAEPVGRSAGALNANLSLAGSLDAPLVDGDLRLENGALTLPLAGLELEDIELRLAHEASNPQPLTLSGGLRSGNGRLGISGTVNPDNGDTDLSLRGEALRAFATADARVLVSPDLNIHWSDDLLRVRGLVTVPRAEITPRLQVGAATSESPAIGSQPGVVIGPSPDVVIVGEETQTDAVAMESGAPLRIDAEVGLVMGPDVTVNAIGLVTRLEGAIGFSLRPEQRDLIPIARGGISLVDGRFRSFGQDLDIETGQVLYSGVPVTEPEVFLRAVRWIDSDPTVSAVGVQLSGQGTAPELELFSRPQLDTAEIQSYLLTGTGTGENSAVLAIGTQLNERVYVGYGYNLLEETSEFDALFSVTPRYGLGAELGEADSNFNLMFTYEK